MNGFVLRLETRWVRPVHRDGSVLHSLVGRVEIGRHDGLFKAVEGERGATVTCELIELT